MSRRQPRAKHDCQNTLPSAAWAYRLNFDVSLTGADQVRHLLDIADYAIWHGKDLKSPPHQDSAAWDELDTLEWYFAIQCHQNAKAVECFVFGPGATERVIVCPDTCRAVRVRDPAAHLKGMWHCGRVLVEVGEAFQHWASALETGIVEGRPVLSDAASKVMANLAGDCLAAWYATQEKAAEASALAREKARMVAVMVPVAANAARPMPERRQDVAAVGPRIRNVMAANA